MARVSSALTNMSASCRPSRQRLRQIARRVVCRSDASLSVVHSESLSLPESLRVLATPLIASRFSRVEEAAVSAATWVTRSWRPSADAGCRSCRRSTAPRANAAGQVARTRKPSGRQPRVNNLALVKPDKAKSVENYLIQLARHGQLPGQLTDKALVEILEKVSQQTEKKITVKFNRRKVMDSDEEDDD